jgi:hypothetical protein
MKPKAHQFLTYGDAIGDYTLEIQKILRANGYESEIFSEIVHPRMAKYVKSLHEYALEQDDDVLMIVHFSIGSALGDLIPHLKVVCRHKYCTCLSVSAWQAAAANFAGLLPCLSC